MFADSNGPLVTVRSSSEQGPAASGVDGLGAGARLAERERAREQGSDGGIKPVPATMAELVPQLQPPTPDVVLTAETPPAPSSKMQTS